MTEEEWKVWVNYAIRNIEVGDEEEIRIPEDKTYFMEGFKEEGVSEEDLLKLDRLIIEDCFDLNYDAILEILLPYKSHAVMYAEDYDRWEFQTWNDPDEWKDFEEWMNE